MSFKEILRIYSSDEYRAWDQDTQIYLLTTFLDQGGGDINAFIKHLNNHVDEERMQSNLPIGDDYPYMTM
jgi:hypothetical protein